LKTSEDAERFIPRDPRRLAYITQTTLSVDDTAAIVAILKSRFPDIVGPRKEDICYATTNRQEAVKAIAARCDRVIVVGAPNSSNSLRLVDGGRARRLPQGAAGAAGVEIPWSSSRASPRSASPRAPRRRSSW
jgi:4-hydroxy-3-methylbut-2-enyl diphosphate reductase